MYRLTQRWGEQPYPNLAGKVVCEYKECDSTRSCEDCIHGQYKDRLAAYEDTGLEPEEIKRIYQEWSHYLNFAGERNAIEGAIEDIYDDGNIDYNRLRELVEADQEGRCYITAVKVGERVFLPNEKGKIIGARVQGISLPAHGKNLIIHLGGYPAEYLWSDREGKDWWKTRAEAEAALRREQDG